ncbi:MAG: S-methyl-5-thioribose-1-phosphate isomerase [Candidatus Micrarchaeia archaeon]|jgi:S-methyl-5-thioribose-1-phosphate isomerase
MRVFHLGKGRQMRSVEFEGNRLALIDQRLLPFEFKVVECKSAEQVAEAIRNMTVRGAPALGVAGAYGFALGLEGVRGGKRELDARAKRVFELLVKARPTAVNLRNCLARVFKATQHARTAEEGKLAALAMAERINYENLVACRMIGINGAKLVRRGARILTICNSGPLACVDYGTAFAVIAEAHRQKKLKMAYACETRPRGQGALTSWEMLNEGIPHKVVADFAAGDLMRRKEVDLVIVGADRIAKNGDFANKIGTYTLAVLAHENNVPFYVAAPMSTFDLNLKNGAGIPVEERGEEEVLSFRGVRVHPKGAKALNRAFDVTPHKYVRGIVTEAGLVKRRNEEGKLDGKQEKQDKKRS